MDAFIKLIYCCYQEEIKNNKIHNELEVPIEKEGIKDKKMNITKTKDKKLKESQSTMADDEELARRLQNEEENGVNYIYNRNYSFSRTYRDIRTQAI